MKAWLLAIGLVALPAQAQLYRWVDPDSGSVKFSSYPPPWYREEGQVGPAVEVIQQRPAAPAAKPAPPKPAAARPAAPAPDRLDADGAPRSALKAAGEAPPR